MGPYKSPPGVEKRATHRPPTKWCARGGFGHAIFFLKNICFGPQAQPFGGGNFHVNALVPCPCARRRRRLARNGGRGRGVRPVCCKFPQKNGSSAQARTKAEISHRHLANRSFWGACAEILPRDLLWRSCSEIFPGDLLQRSCQQSSSRDHDHVQRSCQKTSYRDLVQRPGEESSDLAQSFFPRASERRVLLIAGVCQTFSHLHIFTSHLIIFTSSTHLLIFTSSHPHILTSSHPHIFTSSHLHIFSSSHHIFTSYHLHIFNTSSHPHILTSSHLHTFSSSQHIFTTHLHTFSSSHLLIFTSSHPTSSHPHILTSSHLHIFSSSHHIFITSSHLHIFTSSHLHIFTFSLALLPSSFSFFSISLLFYFSFLRRGAVSTRRQETQPFARNEVRSPKTDWPFRTKWGSIAKNSGKIAILKCPRQPCRTKSGSIAKNWGKIAILSVPRQPCRTKQGSIAKNWG